MDKKDLELTLDSEVFNSLKSDFNLVLRKTLSMMLQKEGETAEMKLALKITLMQSTAPDLEITDYNAEREIVVPKFDHKVSSVMQYKDEKSGTVGGAGFELMWDKDACCYIMRSIKSNQRSFFDDEKEESKADEKEAAPAEPAMLPETASQEPEVIEAEYRDLEEVGNTGEAVEAKEEAGETEQSDGDDFDALVFEAVGIVREENSATVSLLQRRLKLGYSKAARLLDELEKLHVVGPFNGSQPREVLPIPEEE